MKRAKILYNGLPVASAATEGESPVITLSGCTVTDHEAFDRLLAQAWCTVICGDKAYQNCTILTYSEPEGTLTLMPDVE